MKKQILVVDDELHMLSLLSIVFTRAGFSVLKAKNARGALAILDSVTPDLCVLDVMMPEIDGIELCRRIRARAQTAATPVILVSALYDAGIVARAFEAGADDYVVKPIAHLDLIARARGMLNIPKEEAS